MIEIEARPYDLLKFPERVTALRPPRLVRAQVAADDVWTCVSERSGGVPTGRNRRYGTSLIRQCRPRSTLGRFFHAAIRRPRCAVCLCARLRICRRRRAQVLADDLAKRFPENTLVQVSFLPTLRAKLSVSRGNTSEAIETLRAAAPFELGQTIFSTYGWNVMYPVFVRAEAYLGAHQSSGAVDEFQKTSTIPASS